MKFNFILNNFASGEWSPRMKGRTDVDQYYRSCETLTNFIPQMSGGAQFRGGTRYYPTSTALRTALNSMSSVGMRDIRMMPYLDTDGITSTILFALNSGPSTWFHNNLNDNGAITLGANVSLTTWNSLQTHYVQVGDFLVLVNNQGNQKPLLFYYNGATTHYTLAAWGYDTFTNAPSLWKMIPWDKINALSTNVSISPSGTTGSITLTASASYFTSNMVGSYIRLCDSNLPAGVCRITGYTSGTSVSATVVQTLPHSAFQFGSSANASSFWQESAWSDAKGWPRTVTSFQGRIIFGGNDKYPDTVWGSRTSSYFDFEEIPEPNTTGPFGFSGGAYANDNSRPFALTPNSGEVSNIVALSAAKTLVIHTERNEVVAYGSNGGLGPVNAVFESSTTFGGRNVQPIRVNNYLTFVQSNGTRLRDLIFNFTEDQYKSTDLSFVADHFFLQEDHSSGTDFIVDMARIEDKSSTLYARTDTGRLYGLTLDRDYQVNAWFRMNVGGDTTGDTGFAYPFVVAMCTFPFSTKQNALWLLVRRKVGSGVRYVLEVMEPPWEYSEQQSIAVVQGGYQARYLDSYTDMVGQNADGDGKSTIWKFSPGVEENMWRNRTVSIKGDGTYIGEITVADTATPTVSVTTTERYARLELGYKYQGKIVTMPIEAGGQFGTPLGRIKRIEEVVVRFFKSVGCTLGADDTDQEPLPFRDSSLPANVQTPYYTGDFPVHIQGGYDRAAKVTIIQDTPNPCHVLAVAMHGVTYD